MIQIAHLMYFNNIAILEYKVRLALRLTVKSNKEILKWALLNWHLQAKQNENSSVDEAVSPVTGKTSSLSEMILSKTLYLT